jgi:hypothetical protein
LIQEVLVGVAFLAVACIAFRCRSFLALLFLAFGYLLHAAYDFSHNLLFANAGTPRWWPEFCATVDIVLGAYIAYLAFSYPRKSFVREQRV